MSILSSFSNTHFHSFSASALASNRNNTMASLRHHHRKDKVVVVMGATGTGKSRLSIDLAAYFPAEVINSDKIQLYHGLDTTTNKIPFSDRRSVPHHLLGDRHPDDGDITPSDFRSLADLSIASISSRRNLPLVVGGSNSFIHALLVDTFDPDTDVFHAEFRYDCCFIWVDVSFSVLSDYLSHRVDHMLDSGMFEELAEFFEESEPASESANRTGLWKAIGVPEFYKYFRKYPPRRARPEGEDPVRRRAYEEAVREIKENTRQLVKRQMGKIQRLRDAGWDLKRVDATEAFEAVAASDSGRRWSDIWETRVVKASVKIVKRFLEDE